MAVGQNLPSAVAPEASSQPVAVSVPAAVAAAARAAFDTVDRSADLAQLVSDSLDDPGTDTQTRTLHFEHRQLTVQAVLRHDAAAGRRLVVEVRPVPDGGLLEVETRGVEQPTVTDEAPGCWSVQPVPSGPVSMVVHDGERRVRTAWTLL